MWFKINPMMRYAYIFLLVLCFLAFQQGDLFHTSGSSYAYLNGHWEDFYEYNKLYFGRNDYLPLIYLIFALWNLPLHIAGLANSLGMELSLVEIVWAKLLLVVFFFACVHILSKISLLLGPDANVTRSDGGVLFATAPIAIFAVFIFGQYDIIGLYFTLLGFYFFLKKDLLRFSLFFSVAISFKYFALFSYIPLLLMMEKRVVHLIKYAMIGFLATGVQIALYAGSDVFLASFSMLAGSKATGAYGNGLSLANPTLYGIVFYLLGCLFLYLKRFDVESYRKKIAVLVPIGAYGLMFLAVTWHPQWIIIIMPFFALSYAYVKNKRILGYVDLIGMLAFVWLCCSYWPNHVDASMLTHGALRSFIPQAPLLIYDLLPLNWLFFFKIIFYTYLFSPILFVLIESIFCSKSESELLDVNSLSQRFFIGLALFLIPALICTFIPVSTALRLAPQAIARIAKPMDIATIAELPLGEIITGAPVIQFFKSPSDGLTAISVELATYARSNTGLIKLSLTDMTGEILAEQTINAKDIMDNKLHYFSFSPMLNSRDQDFKFIIEAEKSYPGNAITAWRSKEDVYLPGKLFLGQHELAGDLVMKMYFLTKHLKH